ncbi:MAG: tetratricopeptide repeat protein [Patescibacteria group bacterium]|jgi:tetratricopeptide (TPR) repeat protein
MIFYIIVSSIAAICLIVIAFIVIQKFSKLAAIDLEAMKHHKQKQVKVSIVEERLERNLREIKTKITVKSAPLRKRLKKRLGEIYSKAIKLQKEYKNKALHGKPLKQEDKEAIRQKVNGLVQDAEELTKQAKYVEAEKKYIEAISLDKQNMGTYKGLGDLYVTKKDYDHARETFEFIKEISPNDDVIWRQLGSLYELLNHQEKAVKYYKKAVDIAPKNPKNLDLLFLSSIKAKDRLMAKEALKNLEEVNPENNNLPQYKQQLKDL